MGLIRVLLALAVVVGHTRGSLGALLAAPEAVEAFFIISGFYMGLILDGKYDRSSRGRLLFWQNRCLRLMPTYWIVFAVSLPILLCDPANPLRTRLPHMSPSAVALVLFANLFVFGQDSLMFLGSNPETGERGFHYVSNLWAGRASLPAWNLLVVPQAWSLAIELLFYLTAPFLAAMTTAQLSAIAAASLMIRRAIYHWVAPTDPWAYRFFPNELIFFVLGLLSYRLYRKVRWSERQPALLWACFGLCLALILFGRATSRSSQLLFVGMPLLLPGVFELTRRSRLDARLGDLSYPVYMTHWILAAVLERFGLNRPEIVGSLAILASMALVRFVEHPVDRIRQRRARQLGAPPAPSAAFPQAAELARASSSATVPAAGVGQDAEG